MPDWHFENLLTSRRFIGDGHALMGNISPSAAALVFFDPQYRSLLDAMKYGNEGKGARLDARVKLPQMSDAYIRSICDEAVDILRPSGHLMLWVDKYLLIEGWRHIVPDALKSVDMITWDKERIGMGYRTRRRTEYLIVLQNLPKRAKGVWTRHDIPDNWRERVPRATQGGHPHQKPLGLIKAVIEAATEPGDLVVDPAAGSFAVEEACKQLGRASLCADLAPWPPVPEVVAA